jgi:hypothetical protein
MEKCPNSNHDFVVFKPTGQLVPVKKIKKEYQEFYSGELTEEFALYCASESIHAFWVNYKNHDKKIEKEMFSKYFKEIINEMLDNL